MCGIAGLMNFGRTGRDNMERMKARMAHRGPDQNGTFVSADGTVVLGHQRLSILDITEAGAQPFTTASGRSVIVYNGEIYNAPELREKLVAEGTVESFRSTCDTEILAEAIEAWGVRKTLDLAKGMFAFCVYDRQEQTLTLARDRVGEKPLYYGFIRNPEGSRSFVFASDLGSIAAVTGFDNPVNRGVLDLYFVHGYIPAPYTIYEGIHKLIPGTVLTVKAPFGEEDLKTEVYWSMRKAAENGREHPFTGTREEAADELERLLRSAIRGQMASDVPLGAFLSAGIDSPTIVSLMQAESTVPVQTFTIGMNDPAFNEAEAARAIAAHLGTKHTEMTITEQDAKDVIPLLPRMFSEPFADSSQIPTYLVSKLTRQHVTVSLSGDAGDELFCGYNVYDSVERIWNKIRNVPAGIRKPASFLVLHSPLARDNTYRTKGVLLGASCPEDLYKRSRETDPLTLKIAGTHPGLPYVMTEAGADALGNVNKDLMLLDLELYHPDDILVKVDRTAMAVSLETRVPFLDRDVVEFAWTVPISFLRGTERDAAGRKIGKLLLRDVLYRYVPKEMMDRPKKGFSIPIGKWLLEPALRPWAEDLLSPSNIRAEGFLNADVVEKIWRDYTERGIWRVQIWYLLMFEAWLRMVKEDGYQPV